MTALADEERLVAALRLRLRVETELGEAVGRVTEAEARLREVTADRDRLIRCLHDEGASLRQIARLAGLSAPTVGRIVNETTDG